MIEWDKRFERQLRWTKQLRNYLFKKINWHKMENLLDLGCGTGLLLNEIGQKYSINLYGIDISEERLKVAKNRLEESNVNARLIYMDFLKNQFEDNKFDIVVTNCFFLWVKNLRKAFSEIDRILKEDGILLILAEPDYGGLIECPETNLKNALYSNLKKEGADPEVGRKLNQYFDSRFKVLEHFCTSIPWIGNVNKEDLNKELEFFKHILAEEDFHERKMKLSIETGKYFIFVPIFSYYLRKSKTCRRNEEY
ncbi:MAG: class I SAM-dependent methyltransferase [Promethearchaeia archaeon]